MKVHDRYMSALLALVLGCGGGATPAAVEPSGVGSGPTGGGSVSTGLEGTAQRSPIRPVCQVDKACSAPFSSGFEVWQENQLVARFQSDEAGHFLVPLAPGNYTVVPDASAPLLARAQAQKVTVGPSGLTHVEWDFDTGIR